MSKLAAREQVEAEMAVERESLTEVPCHKLMRLQHAAVPRISFVSTSDTVRGCRAMKRASSPRAAS